MAIAKVLLVDDEVPFVDTMIKRLTKRNMDVCQRMGAKNPYRNSKITSGWKW